MTPQDDYSSSYPVKQKEMVSKIKGARKFAKAGPGGGVGKSAAAISPGKKGKKKKRK